jgi:WD40 repeat protein
MSDLAQSGTLRINRLQATSLRSYRPGDDGPRGPRAGNLAKLYNRPPAWDADGKLLATLEGHKRPVKSAVFSTDGAFIITASEDQTARLWARTQTPRSWSMSPKNACLAAWHRHRLDAVC